MFPKALLTSHSRMSGSRWVMGVINTAFHSSAYSCHLFLISSASVRSLTIFVFYCVLPCMKCCLDISNFLEEIFPIPLFSSMPLHCTFQKGFLSLVAILWDSAFSWVCLSSSPFPFTSLLSSVICKNFFRQPLCLLPFLFPGNGFGHHLLYNVMNLHL